MRALPDDGWSARGNGSASAPLEGGWVPGGVVSHGFTHFELELQLMLYSGEDWDRLPNETGEWWPIVHLEQAGLPTLFAKVARLAIASED
jgi:A/G-specific adenine glycosylase